MVESIVGNGHVYFGCVSVHSLYVAYACSAASFVSSWPVGGSLIVVLFFDKAGWKERSWPKLCTIPAYMKDPSPHHQIEICGEPSAKRPS